MAGNAEQVLTLARSREPTLGAGRLICVDGPAGSGKTTLATELSELGGAPVLHMDDMYEGWSGLLHISDQLESVLRPLAIGQAGSYRRWDWHANAWAEAVLVPPAPLLVLEGVGCGSAQVADLVTVLAWVDAPYELRMQRGVARDGAAFADHWRQWAMDEQDLFSRERTRERADIVLDGDAGSPDG
ncbi:MAG: 4-amino-4-deoxy-L-arabinose transferase [Nocardioides sp.]|nr:4-amino-4-deoxy-L-arabinose transferase [Nocardioides sp.]